MSEREKILMSEPFTNLGGLGVAIYDTGGLIALELDRRGFFYGRDEVSRAGQGDLMRGIVRLGQVANYATEETTSGFCTRPALEVADEFLE